MIIKQWKGPLGGLFVQIACDDCKKERTLLGTHAKRALHKNNHFCSFCFKRFHNDFKRTEEMKNNISKGTKLGMSALEVKERIKTNQPNRLGKNNSFFGKKHRIDSLLKISENNFFRGKCNPWWKSWMIGPRNQWAKQIRKMFAQKCAKCNKTQQECKNENIKLDAHHIAPVSEHPEFRYDLNNGIALCRSCHVSIHHLLKEDIFKYEIEIKLLIEKQKES